MAIRLKPAGCPVWHALPHGVRVKCKPVTAAIVAAAQSHGRRALSELPEDERADPHWAAGFAFAETVTAIARLSIVEWDGVQGEDGEAAPVTPETIGMLMQQDDLALAFWTAATATVHEVIAEGNG